MASITHQKAELRQQILEIMMAAYVAAREDVRLEMYKGAIHALARHQPLKELKAWRDRAVREYGEAPSV